MMIDINKKYQTRGGRPVEIVTTRARNSPKRPVIGYVGDDVDFTFWSHEGVYDVYGGSSYLDLVEVTPKHVMWLNVYQGGNGVVHESREDADEGSMENRIARLKIQFEEGQFDE